MNKSTTKNRLKPSSVFSKCSFKAGMQKLSSKSSGQSKPDCPAKTWASREAKNGERQRKIRDRPRKAKAQCFISAGMAWLFRAAGLRGSPKNTSAPALLKTVAASAPQKARVKSRASDRVAISRLPEAMPRAAARRRAFVLFPEPDGPSIAI